MTKKSTSYILLSHKKVVTLHLLSFMFTRMKKYDYLIVGSGLFGATFAFLAKQQGKRCLVIDKREHLGGNIYCENIEGINVHKYGAHIFHTSNKRVWDFVNSFVPFNNYINQPVANYKGRIYNLPFNMNTFYQMWGTTTPAEAMEHIERQRVEATRGLFTTDDNGNRCPRKPRNLEEQALTLVGHDVYNRLIKEYTEKQWGRKCRELPPFIIRRLPIRFTFDNNYFNDLYQGIPCGGYNKLTDQLLQGCDCLTGTDFFRDEDIAGGPLRKYWHNVAEQLVYTGPIDEYFNFCHGRLDWRTVTFKTRTENTPNYQGNAVVNYTSHVVPYTRIIEHKHFEMFGNHVYDNPLTVVSEEYPTEYHEGMEPYYPVNNDRNNAIAELYRDMAAKETGVIFGGRLAQYRYYDMAPVIEAAMACFENE